MLVDGIELDLSGHRILPGFVNAHDHLEFALYPKLGAGPYPNAAAWARDIYHPEQSPIREHLAVPKHIRLLWGGLRNLLAGVTTVCHHNPHHPVFDSGFPVRVAASFGWAHSLAFDRDLVARHRGTNPESPFIVHAAEGIDADAGAELYRLRDLGVLNQRTVLVHAVGLTKTGWRVMKQRGSAVIWCPRSNVFTLGRTLQPEALQSGVPIALATDSPITADGDLLDELAFASSYLGVDVESLLPMVTDIPQRLLKLPPQPCDWIAVKSIGGPPALVVIGGRIHLIDAELAAQASRSLCGMFPISMEGRPTVLVRASVPELIRETQGALGSRELRLGGRVVSG